MSQLSVSGAASGIDTASIINSLVSVQQNQQNLLKNEQATQQSAADTYGSLISALGGLSTLATNLANTSAWKGATATSSSTSVTATATSNTAASLTFDVTSVARAHTVISADAVNSLSANVATGPLTITKNDGTTVSINSGSGSLADVVAGINASTAGLTAAAVQTAPGQYRLQIASAATGAASSFTTSGLTGFSAMNVLTQGTDAAVSVGTDPATKYTATSSTNTFASLVPGISFTVNKVDTGVTVSTALDGTAVAGDIQKLVDSANSVLSSISAATSYNTTTKSGGPLVGDSATRSLQQSILNLVSGASAPGVSLTRNGTLSFDQTAFNTAFQKDPVGTAAKYGATATFAAANGASGSVTFGSATSVTRAGTYGVNVSSLGAREQWTFDGSNVQAGQTISLVRGTTSVSYTVGASDALSDVVSALNTRSASSGFGVGVALSGTTLQFTANSAGSAQAFTTNLDGTAQTQVTAGADAQGTIDGQTATGVGNTLSLPSGTGGAVGLSLNLGLTQSDLDATGGAVGSVSYAPGLAQRFAQLVQQQTASTTGLLSSAQAGRQSAVKSFQDQIDAWDARLTAYRATLQTQFTAMETAIQSLKSQAASMGLTTSSSTSSSASATGNGTLTGG